MVAVPTLEALLGSSHYVTGVLSKPDARSGRGRRLQPSPVSSAARDLGLDVMTPTILNQDVMDHIMGKWYPDVVVVVAYGLRIPRDLIDVPRYGWVNAHFSALPAWRGAAPVQHAIAHGDTNIAVTTFRIDQGLDTGPILKRSESLSIADRDDSGHMLARLAPLAGGLIVETLDGLASGELHPTPQGTREESYAPRILVDQARINWHKPVREVDRWIRACTPEPGAWTMYGEHRLRIGTPREIIDDETAAPGNVIVEKNRVRVAALGGFLVLDSVQAPGKKIMDGADWARGLREAIPESFDS
jgi:methionyl-tRNA formyltransferase